MLIKTDSINWCWFVRYYLNADETVEIVSHYRKHKYEGEWTEEEKNAPMHPNYYGDQQIKEDDKRTAIEFFVPGLGWRKISNPKNVFSYKEEA